MAKTHLHIGDLRPDKRNARKHNERNIGMIASSLQELGAGRSILIDGKNEIIAGHGVIEAAALAGIESVRVVEADGNEIIAVRRADLKGKRKQRMALADNRSAELAEWDAEALAAIAANDGDALKGLFSGTELERIVGDLGGGGAPEPREDIADQLREKWGVERGQIWLLGAHRLMCGDSTSAEDMPQLMQEEKAGLMVTDPPYGVNYEGGQANTEKRARIVADDDTVIFGKALCVVSKAMPSGAWYIWHAGRCAEPVYAAIRENGYEVRSLLIWNKIDAHYGAPSAHYCQKHEPCLYAVRGSAGFVGPSNEVTVWDIKQPQQNELHPTQKPLECMARPIRNHAAAIVLDPFLGSGTTLIAAEQLGRACYAMEIEPKYVAVSIQRWVDMTGGEPRLES